MRLGGIAIIRGIFSEYIVINQPIYKAKHLNT